MMNRCWQGPERTGGSLAQKCGLMAAIARGFAYVPYREGQDGRGGQRCIGRVGPSL
jgi:hypothetical protein